MNSPLGGKLQERIATAAERRKILAARLPHIEISERKIVEVKNIGYGTYSPLTGFVTKKDFDSILDRLSTAKGVFWPIPIILDISQETRKRIGNVKEVLLVSTTSKKPIAHMHIQEVYTFPKNRFCRKIFGTTHSTHPGVKKTEEAGRYLVGGDILLLDTKKDVFPKYNFTPKEVRAMFKKKGWRRIVGFHTRNVPHLGHEHVQQEGLKTADGIFVNPLVGEKKAGDFRNEVVLKAYEYLAQYILPKGKVVLGVLPYSPYYAGPREALLTAAIRKNFGCTHFIVGRDHTGVGAFYKPSDYVRIIKANERRMGIKILHLSEALYCTECSGMTFSAVCPHGEKYWIRPSGTKVRRSLVERAPIPKEMMRPEIVTILMKEKELFV